MTQRYMHLTPAALDAAIRLLEEPNGPTSSYRTATAGVTDARPEDQSRDVWAERPHRSFRVLL